MPTHVKRLLTTVEHVIIVQGTADVVLLVIVSVRLTTLTVRMAVVVKHAPFLVMEKYAVVTVSVKKLQVFQRVHASTVGEGLTVVYRVRECWKRMNRVAAMVSA